ncbi:phage portal protein [Aureibacillus halotolerans]|uniref:HK97 family phage portal protein n=1 Tax=Aureibacillus halotolerans TaxID=1508390 RepID=A0A4R6TZ33_9BACI|nr:phage portal protein [Aureibacillus halotolerans]TDQ39230.1 HK97 family phage portal protein [Aureibacillus halotolerans]
MILDRILNRGTQKRSQTFALNDPHDWFANLFGGRETKSGIKVSKQTAWMHPDVFSCVNVLSDDVAKLPLRVYRKQKGSVEPAPEHPVNRLLYEKPNEYMTPYVFKKLLETHLGFYGNAYAFIKFSEDGSPVELMPMLPNQVHPHLDPSNGRLYYQVTIHNKNMELYPEQVLHFKQLTTDGIIGKSPVEVAAEHVGAQYAATAYNSKLYQNDATPRGILKVPAKLNTDAKNSARDEWIRVNQGENIAIIDAGLEYQSVSMPLEQAQFVESMKYNRSQIAAIYKVPPHKINELDRATFSNIEQQSLDYVKNTLQPKLVNFEQEVAAKLFTDAERRKGYYVKFNVNSELRGDSKSRAEFYEVMLRIGAMSINEIRGLEEQNAIENGDRHLVSLNYTFLDKLEEYQMAKAGSKGGEANGEGNPENNNTD